MAIIDYLPAPVGRYAQYLSPLVFVGMSMVLGLPPFLLHLALNPLTYLNPSVPFGERVGLARRRFFYIVWRLFGGSLDKTDAPRKSPVLARARGTVLEIGAGTGDNIKYYKRTRVMRLILVEPNTNMHMRLRAAAEAQGYRESDGTLLLLGCGGAAADEAALALGGVQPGTMDTVVAVHVLCGIPAPAQAVELYRRLLRPEGELLFYEHVRNGMDAGAAAWQRWYTHFWPYAFDGCHLDRPTGAWIMGGPGAADGKPLASGVELVDGPAGVQEIVKERWRDAKIWRPDDEPRYAQMAHVLGWAVKA